MSAPPAGLLSGIRVLDLGTMIAGPVAATLLADFGADVIKVEQPQGGDTIRSNGPIVEGQSLWWNVEGRNKRSITLDLRLPEGQALLRQLAGKADVLVENFRPGTLDRWGLGYPALQALNPRLVMLSVSGYGQTGPNAQRAAYDRIALAFAGFLHITGEAEGPPLRPGTAVADYLGALMGAFAVMLALYHRDARGGPGQYIDLALFEAVFRFSDVLITAYDKLGVVRHRRGNLHFAAAPGNHFATQDGRFLVLTVSNDGVFRRLCDAMEQPDLLSDHRFGSHALRWQHIDEINEHVARWIASQPVLDVCARLDRHGLAYSLVYSAADIAGDPHYAARETIATVATRLLGDLKMPAPQPRMSATPAGPLRAAPDLGQDTDAILHELLELPGGEIDRLRKAGVI
ncbi:formyl-CoA transferase [Panacagrimonas perspica]|uniref:Formyl-CoA transferase n=1 Tax=Panacagrimonas perspica TaxID=381431 RepID=A0A4R7PC82_9GAMM|nr:CaiB/BaiF CoA-transferase family protein [Panacagrimonas perspica]TDU31683.1 formyl-CoA transferase [Panacagrimonas perspica]